MNTYNGITERTLNQFLEPSKIFSLDLIEEDNEALKTISHEKPKPDITISKLDTIKSIESPVSQKDMKME